MPSLLRRTYQSAFARHVAVLVSGTALGSGLAMLAAPVLSRLYSPAEFGLLAVFTSLVSILAEVGSWRYEVAIVLPQDDDQAANVSGVAAMAVMLTTLVTLACVALGHQLIARLLGSPEVAPYLWWVPAAVLAIGAYRIATYWVTRQKRFRQISIAQVARSVGLVAVQILAGWLGCGASGLIGGRVVGELTAMLTLAGGIWRQGTARLCHAITWPAMRSAAREYADFPKYSLPQGLVNAVSQSVPVFMLAHYFDAPVVGLYAMAHRLLYLPSRFIGQSVRQVFLQRASESHAQGDNLHRLMSRTTLALASLGIVPAAVIVLFGPQLFSLALGSQWQVAGQYARWMTLWLYLIFLNPPATVLCQVLRKQKFLLAFDVALLVGRILALLLGGLYFDALTTVALFSLVGGSFTLALITVMWFYTRRGHRGTARP